MHYRQIKTLEAVYKVLGVKPEEILFQAPLHPLQVAANGFINACLIAEAYNLEKNGNRWNPNYHNPEEAKHSTYWNIESKISGASGFTYIGCVADSHGSSAGARLVFRDEDRGMSAALRFPEVFNSFMTIPKLLPREKLKGEEAARFIKYINELDMPEETKAEIIKNAVEKF